MSHSATANMTRPHLPPRLTNLVRAGMAQRGVALIAPTRFTKTALLDGAVHELRRQHTPLVAVSPLASESEWAMMLQGLRASADAVIVLDDCHRLTEERAHDLASALRRADIRVLAAGRRLPEGWLARGGLDRILRVIGTDQLLWTRADIAAVSGMSSVPATSELLPGSAWPGLAQALLASPVPDAASLFAREVVHSLPAPLRRAAVLLGACGTPWREASAAIGITDEAMALLSAWLPLEVTQLPGRVRVPGVLLPALQATTEWAEGAELARSRHIEWLLGRGLVAAASRECLRVGRRDEARTLLFERVMAAPHSQTTAKLACLAGIPFSRPDAVVEALISYLRVLSGESTTQHEALAPAVRGLRETRDALPRLRVASLLLGMAEKWSYSEHRDIVEMAAGLAGDALRNPAALTPLDLALVGLHHARYLTAHGRLLEARCVLDIARERANHAPAWVRAALHSFSALVTALLGDILEAQDHLDATSLRGSTPGVATETAISRSLLLMDQGHDQAAEQLLHDADLQTVTPFVAVVASACLAQTQLHQGRPDDARATLTRAENRTSTGYERFVLASTRAELGLHTRSLVDVLRQMEILECCGLPPEQDIVLATMRARIEIIRDLPDPAVRILEPHVRDTVRATRQSVDALITYASACEGSGRVVESIRALQRAGAVAHSLGINLAQGHHPRMTKGMARSEVTLTRSERSVLRALAQPIPLSAVAESLYLSQNTLKTHTRHLYAKLGVRDRGEAVRVAASLRLN